MITHERYRCLNITCRQVSSFYFFVNKAYKALSARGLFLVDTVGLGLSEANFLRHVRRCFRSSSCLWNFFAQKQHFDSKLLHFN